MNTASLARGLQFLCLCALFPALSGCGAGTAGVASAVKDDGDGNASAVVSDLDAPREVTSPSSIFFVLTDEEGDSANVSILFSAPGGSFKAITLDPASNPLNNVPSNTGKPYKVLWNFAADLGGEGYQSGIRIQLAHAGISPPILGGVEMGNDPPVITKIESPPADEDTAGNAEVEFTIRDSAADRVNIKVEYNADSENDFPEASWTLARPTGLSSETDTPPFAFKDLPTSADGDQETFIWESDSDSKNDKQLKGKETDVLVRFTPLDDFEGGETRLTTQFHIDNNNEPLAILEEGSFLLNPDQRRGIPVPFNVLDDESDPVRVVLQWRREEQSDFPPLPGTVAEILELLDDPARDDDRQRAQIGRQFPQPFTGRVGFLDPLRPPIESVCPSLRAAPRNSSHAASPARHWKSCAPTSPRKFPGSRIRSLRRWLPSPRRTVELPWCSSETPLTGAYARST